MMDIPLTSSLLLCIIFQGNDVKNRILTTLLNEMDGIVRLNGVLVMVSSSSSSSSLSLSYFLYIYLCIYHTHAHYYLLFILFLYTSLCLSDTLIHHDICHSPSLQAATNRIDLLDAALLRPGRFDYTLEVPLPNSSERAEIFRLNIARMGDHVYRAKEPTNDNNNDGIIINTVHTSEEGGTEEQTQMNRKDHSKHTNDSGIKPVNEDELAALTPGFSGADIEGICIEAAMLAIKQSPKDPIVVWFHLPLFFHFFCSLSHTFLQLLIK